MSIKIFFKEIPKRVHQEIIGVSQLYCIKRHIKSHMLADGYSQPKSIILF